ncbi:MAG: class I SAM-dependent methyltransferase [Lachnospiraceae bacterium]
MSKKIKKAYKSTTKFYDDLLTHSSIWGKLYMKIFWSGMDDNRIADVMMSYIPDDFNGTILDVPVGTAVFTEKKWKSLSNANIICLDYSEDMLLQAKKRLGTCPNISCVQGDVGNLPVDEASCDIVLSMNGFHVFPDKEKAYHEIHRVLKPDGIFIASFYVKGKNKLSDCLVACVLAKKGWFTKPFQTAEEVKITLEQKYEIIEMNTEGSFVYFKCRKHKENG